MPVPLSFLHRWVGFIPSRVNRNRRGHVADFAFRINVGLYCCATGYSFSASFLLGLLWERTSTKGEADRTIFSALAPLKPSPEG